MSERDMQLDANLCLHLVVLILWQLLQVVAVVLYFLFFSVFFLPALIATAPHTWLSHESHAKATQLFCSAHSTSFASRIIGYLITHFIWMLAAMQHLSH
jgi:hypothetical protein